MKCPLVSMGVIAAVVCVIVETSPDSDVPTSKALLRFLA